MSGKVDADPGAALAAHLNGSWAASGWPPSVELADAALHRARSNAPRVGDGDPNYANWAITVVKAFLKVKGSTRRNGRNDLVSAPHGVRLIPVARRGDRVGLGVSRRGEAQRLVACPEAVLVRAHRVAILRHDYIMVDIESDGRFAAISRCLLRRRRGQPASRAPSTAG